jgi:GST-like protein
MLEEVGLVYEVRPVDIGQGEQFDPDYLALNPNNKIPVLIDDDGNGRHVVFETGAVLIYLAEKTRKLLRAEGPRRAEQLAWLFWSSTGLAPMLGQWNWFARRAPDKTPAAIDHFLDEVTRLFGVMERRLSGSEHLAGDYSIADIGAFTWTDAMIGPVRAAAGDRLGLTPGIDRWLRAINARPAVQRGMTVPKT